ncbi:MULTISPECIES: hypothetical protein [Providencia]|uniref:hypothetical protein n=1 Tax=Providencia TaxID=586 RepID=UPI0018C460D5|nr:MULTISPECIES: hypothetical protein [Providencia]MBG5928417.1 hypothetical protein [Providencia rettgeri]MBQ0532346.1 hypothetical protein [Providencia rettgeri]WOB86942.1 hypothetical protein P3L40_03310 [Providencia sp. PROV040]
MKKIIFALTLVTVTTHVATAQTEKEIHYNAANALNFTENNTSYSNQKSINDHLSKAGISVNDNINSTQSFLQLDRHTQAATALNFTQNSTSPAMQNMISSHQSQSPNYKKSMVKVAKPFSDMNENEKAVTMLNFHKNSSSASIQSKIIGYSKNN